MHGAHAAHERRNSPTANKRIKSVDVMCQGQWSISIGMLPNNTEAFELCATLHDNTYGLMIIPFAGYGTHVGVHIDHQAPVPRPCRRCISTSRRA